MNGTVNPAIKKLSDQARQKAAQAKAILDNPNATTEEIKTAGELADQAEELQGQVAAANGAAAKVAAFDKWDNEPANQLAQPGMRAAKANVGKTYIDILTGDIVEQTGAGVLTGQQIKAIYNPDFSAGFQAWARAGGEESKMKATKDATAAFLEGRDNEGGHFVPPEIISGIIRREPTPTRVTDFVRTLAVSSDQAAIIKANYDSDDLYSSAVRIYKTGEAQSAKKSDKPQFGLLRVDVHGWTGEISISKRFLDDTNFDIMGYFAEEFRTATRNMVAQKILLGSGIGEHWGILTRAGQSGKGPDIIKSGHASQLNSTDGWDAIRKIKNAVPEQYDTNCRYLFNKRSTLDTIEGFKDADGRDLWPESQRAGGESGAPGRLRGYNYALEAFMPDIAANNYPLLFGDFMGYARVFRLGMTIQVLREIEARNGQVVYLVEMREGGDLIEPWRLKALKIAA